ncbi:FISUMP domain-containing protein [Dysgonomonas sp. ZJ709]|uniref:FISUMP domain-containing protein n=1 Tax=Dysgonomonas sp. ZJ709 TaxID=2709797 RepID=UPI0013EE093E|nr:FISUMP domain-containing protein [Dysgonomonas sp. ZJ709]
MMKIQIICLAFFLMLFSNMIYGQVTIGSGEPPASGSLLDLKQEGETTKGLGLPRVVLTELEPEQGKLSESINGGTGDWDEAGHIGLLVYHVTSTVDICESIPAGIYVWNGKKWQKLGLKKEILRPVKELPITSKKGLDQPNSYIVTEPSILRIPIDKAVKVWDGSSWKTAGTDSPANTPLLPTRNFSSNLSAELIWTDNQCGRVILNAPKLEVKDNLIEVWIGDEKGNALIALKDGNDIVWSWHIWATDMPTSTDYVHNTGKQTNRWMDRNLGATSAMSQDINSLGLLYQWGRKDPFVSGRAYEGNQWRSVKKTIYAVDGSVKNEDTPQAVVSSETTNLTSSISNPLRFITGGSISGDWYSTTNLRWDTRWGNKSTVLTTQKSVTDPCPDGWRVPSFNGLSDSDSPWTKIKINTTKPTDYIATTLDKGYDFIESSYFLGWYPISGYRGDSAGSLHNVGYGGYHWSASPSNNGARSLGFNKDNITPWNNNTRANGFSVRCVQE